MPARGNTTITVNITITVHGVGKAHASPKFFQKIMKKTSFVSMTVPSDYVRAHGSKFDNWVALSYNGGRANWKVKVNVNVINNREHVAFEAGWKHFADCHAIVEGEWLKFEIVSRSCFEVTRAR